MQTPTPGNNQLPQFTFTPQNFFSPPFPQAPPMMHVFQQQNNMPAPSKRSDSPSGYSIQDSGSERSISPPPVQPQQQHQPTRVHQRKRRRQQRFGYRTKQNKIDTVYEALVMKYTEQGILAAKEIVLRGLDTIRLHVKKYDALATIEAALSAVEDIPEVKIIGVSIPLSMKNQFQKKGFLVYIKLGTTSMVPCAQEVLRTFAEFRKCEVALPNPAGSSQQQN